MIRIILLYKCYHVLRQVQLNAEVETMILGYSLVTNITLSLPCHPPVTFPDLSPRGYFALEWPAHFAAKGGGRALGAMSESKSGSTQVESSLSSPWLNFFLLHIYIYIYINQLYLQYLQQQWIWSDAWISYVSTTCPTTSWEAVVDRWRPDTFAKAFCCFRFSASLNFSRLAWKSQSPRSWQFGSKNGREGGVSSLLWSY